MNYTDEQLVTMTQQYTVTRDREEYICHIAYKEINKQSQNGREWNKCIDCGIPYPLDMEGANTVFCSDTCEAATEAYLREDMQ